MKNKKIIGIIIVAIAIVVGSIIATQGKGNDIIYEFNGEKKTGDAYYAEMMEQYGPLYIYQYLEKEYFATKTLEEEDKKLLEQQKEELLASNGQGEQLQAFEAALRTYGYKNIDQLDAFLKHSFLRDALVSDNIIDYIEDMDKAVETLNPRILTHTVVLKTRSDADHAKATAPTPEEKALMNQIDAALAKAEDKKIALIETTIEGKVAGESLGYVDAVSPFDEAFLKGALKLKDKELSGWVKSSFGYHRIYVESTDIETLKKEAQFKDALLTLNPSLGQRIVMDAMKKDGVKVDEKFEKELLEFLGV